MVGTTVSKTEEVSFYCTLARISTSKAQTGRYQGTTRSIKSNILSYVYTIIVINLTHFNFTFITCIIHVLIISNLIPFYLILKFMICVLKSVRVHLAYGSDGRSFFVEYS